MNPARLVGFLSLCSLVNIVHGQQDDPDWPDWAYGYMQSLEETDPEVYQVPPCPEMANPRSCGPVGTPLVEDGVKLSLPGTSLTFTRVEANYSWQPADWYPGDHPEMPEIVATGDMERGIRPCALCHFPNRRGKVENGHVAGLPRAYILQQLEAFQNGERVSADYRKVEVGEDAKATEIMRDPRGAFVAYVPVGSVARGRELVTTGGGKTIQCGICHGMGQRGLADVPGIAGRTASYIMRQLWDVKQGSRVSPIMTPVVANLTAEDMLNIVAYLATLSP